ncbi:hypothetical protein JCM5296_001871 [Sporobolomyces johnsonii]
MPAPLWSLPISSRPSHASVLAVVLFGLTFNLGILSTFFLLVLLYPLRLVRATKPRYLRWGKRAFGRVLVLVGHWFAPTEFVLSKGEGVDSEWVERDSGGRVRRVTLPDRAVWISNHSTLADWLFLWQFTYLTSHSPSLYIALKSSLRHLPIIGWACSFYDFIFLDRKWASDKEPFRRQLEGIARTTRDGGEREKLAFLIFPEGTIVTENTRGISTKFAEKTGVSHPKHLLLPRSTGLFFALRHLARTVPSLHLIDLTLAYPLPRRSPSSASSPLFPSTFYSLPSIFLRQVPPPELHVHVRAFELAQIPLGNVDDSEALDGGGADGTPAERDAFERWLRDRWTEKDALMERFYTEGSFVPEVVTRSSSGKKTDGKDDEEEDDDDEDEDEDGRRRGEIAWPVALRTWYEPLQAFAFFLPFVAVWYLVPALYHAGARVGFVARAGAGAGAAASEGGKMGAEVHKLGGEL